MPHPSHLCQKQSSIFLSFCPAGEQGFVATLPPAKHTPDGQGELLGKAWDPQGGHCALNTFDGSCLLPYSSSCFWGTRSLALRWAMALPCSWLTPQMCWARAATLRCASCSASASSQSACRSWCRVSTQQLLVRISSVPFLTESI